MKKTVYDTHTHTFLSSDGKMSAEEAIKTAQEMGLGIAFTEHYDADPLGLTGADDPESPPNAYDFRVNVKKYMAEYERFRGDALLGIEIGLTHLARDRNLETLSGGKFDFVLGSVHIIGKVDIYEDLTYSKRPVVTKKGYLEYILRMVTENDYFDALGHIDYPSRYFVSGSDTAESEMDYDEFKNEYGAIFETLIKKEKPPEINTRRLKLTHAKDNAYKVFKGYKDLGGKYVTLGSDAHTADAVGRNFKAALGICESLSLIPVYFSNREIKY